VKEESFVGYPIVYSRYYILTATPLGDVYNLTSEFIQRVTSLQYDEGLFIVVSLAPIPLAVAKQGEVEAARIYNAIREYLNSPRLRIVASVGDIHFGPLGSYRRVSVGAIGMPIARIVKATYTLPDNESWLATSLATEMNEQIKNPINVDGEFFGSYGNKNV
jgi:hypothetical protein